MSGGWGRVSSLHRYPVKSLAGETVQQLDCDERGFVGDRLWSVRTTVDKIGSGKTTRRFAAVDGLLHVRASTDGHRIALEMPDGRRCHIGDPDAAGWLSQHAGQPLTLSQESTVSHFDDGPVSLIGASSVDALSAAVGEVVDPSRFRANIVFAGAAAMAEDGVIGRRLSVGTAVFEVTMRSTRCVMIDMSTAELPDQHGNLLAVGRLNETCLGVVARVVQPGSISVGDELRLVDS